MASFAEFLSPLPNVSQQEGLAAERAIREAANDNSDRALAMLKRSLDRSSDAIRTYVRSLRYHWIELGDTLEQARTEGILPEETISQFIRMVSEQEKSNTDAHRRISASIKKTLDLARGRLPFLDQVATPFLESFDLSYDEERELRASLRNRLSFLVQRRPPDGKVGAAAVNAYKEAIQSIFSFARIASRSEIGEGGVTHRIIIEVPPALLENAEELWRLEAGVHELVDAKDPHLAGLVILEYRSLGGDPI